MSTKPLFLIRKAKKSSGQPDAVLRACCDFESACATLDYLIVKSGRQLKNYFKAVATNFPVVDDLPPEDEIDFTWCERYQLGKDNLTWERKHGSVIPSANADSINTDAEIQNDDASKQPQLTVVATMPLRHRILAQLLGDGEYLYHVDAEQKAEILRMEMDSENSRVQNMILAAENVEPFKKAIEHDIHRVVNAFSAVFPVDGKTPELGTVIQFFKAWFGTEHIDRGLLVKEWKKGNRVSSISRTPSRANAGGSILTDRGEDFIHDKSSLSRDVATGVLARSMDIDIYDVHPAHAKRIDEIIAENKPPFSVFRDKFINMPGGLDYSRAIVVASVKEAPIGIEAIPARVTEYLNRVLTETDHANPDQLIVDIACGRTSSPMPQPESKKDKQNDEEKPQPSRAMADEPAAPETVEPDPTEHHQNTQPLDAESPVDSVETAYQEKLADLHEARENIPHKNPVDVDKLLAAARREYVEGISDPNDPKWLHENYSSVASNEVEKSEVETGNAQEKPEETAGDSLQEDNEETQSDAGCSDAGDPSDAVASVSTVPDDIQPGIYHDIPNEAYHAGPGVSKSQLDDIADTPALYLWRKNAPVDPEKTKTLDIGTAFHCRVLEPEEFDKRFIVAPEFNRRTNAGKEEEKAFLEECASTGKTVITAAEGRKIELMYQSVMALPLGQWLVESTGYCESSIYWEDPETGILCRCRPDKIIPEYHWIMDVKTTADIHRFKTAYYDYRYYVQDAFYSDGYQAQFGEQPTFVFLVVSTTAECGRYPVEIFMMSEDAKQAGQQEYRRNLQTLSECTLNDEWPAIKTLTLPRWAKEYAND
ncbi:RecE family exodeoxyribonuclease [Raoultella planticola]|uniref:RecE family exodeoxyribonuclease n=1 Tax=Raoultella planticola TaxID=575 RepID=UPI00045A214D|nr:RecE family exodeoxyribonuclease [Raoultella planticola]KAJ96815.1 exonuclease VIII [Raoultella planticola]